MIKIPAKTFLLGEYLALKGGPSLIGLTNPCFELDESKRLHPDCVASRFWQMKTKTSIPFGLRDPFQGKGGMGASSAEFLFAYHQYYGDFNDLEKLHQEYLQCAIGKGQPPSGYDVLAQTQAGICLVHQPVKAINHFEWSFPELGFLLVHTGKKLPTHLYLQDTIIDFDWRQLAQATELGIEALNSKDADKWLSAIHHCQSHLIKSGLQAEYTQAYIKEWQTQYPILAAKGCGAMGVDVIAVFLEKSNIDFMRDSLIKKGIYVLASQHDVYFQNARK